MTLKHTSIALTETGQFTDTILDYINNENSIQSFYTYRPTIDAFKQAIIDKQKEQIDRTLLASVFHKQYNTIEQKEAQQKNIDLLIQPNTFTVCTGHQLCLFTGPLYFIFKIITTINLAKKLKQHYSEYNFVPVYWMASEDHDFEEIKSINLFGKKIVWNNENAKGAVGKLSTVSLTSVLDELQQILGESDNAKELMQLFNDAYLKHATIADATRYLVHQLFANEGLLVIDGDNTELKQSFIHVIEDDVFNNTNYHLVNKTIVELDKQGTKAQVNPREINCFYMIDNLRERIEKNADGTFSVLNTSITFTTEALKRELNQYPERFSPNVVLRPLYQQHLLPNLAYVGGPNELVYWLEYKAMFDNHQINFPVLIPRNFAVLTDEKTNQQIHKLGFSFVDLFNDTDALIKEFISNHSENELSLKEEEQALSTIYSHISAKVSTVDASLKGNVEAELQKALNALKGLETKLLRSEKQKQETSVNQIKKLKDKVFPNGSLQERFDTLAPYYLKSGKPMISELIEAFDPLEFKMVILEL